MYAMSEHTSESGLASHDSLTGLNPPKRSRALTTPIKAPPAIKPEANSVPFSPRASLTALSLERVVTYQFTAPPITNGTFSSRGINIPKAKANAAQGLGEMIEIGIGKRYQENKKSKHSRDAKYGWYRYDTRFGLPVYDEEGEVERYNIFKAVLLIRHAKDNKMYLYDVLNIKKETSKSCQA